jgi:hypothetical protein
MPIVNHAAILAPAPIAESAGNGLRYVLVTAIGYFLAVFAAGFGTLRRTKR